MNNGTRRCERNSVPVDPGTDRCLEDLHRGSDGVIDHDNFQLVRRLQPRREQGKLNDNHAQKQEIVSRKHRACRIEPIADDHQGDRDAAEQTGPALLDTEAKKFITRRRPSPPRHQASEPPFTGDERTKRRPQRGGAGFARAGLGHIDVGGLVRGLLHGDLCGGRSRSKGGAADEEASRFRAMSAGFERGEQGWIAAMRVHCESRGPNENSIAGVRPTCFDGFAGSSPAITATSPTPLPLVPREQRLGEPIIEKPRDRQHQAIA